MKNSKICQEFRKPIPYCLAVETLLYCQSQVWCDQPEIVPPCYVKLNITLVCHLFLSFVWNYSHVNGALVLLYAVVFWGNYDNCRNSIRVLIIYL